MKGDYKMDEVLECLRSQAWERAKGELNSMLVTFRDTGGAPDGSTPRFDRLSELIGEFVEVVESEGLNQ